MKLIKKEEISYLDEKFTIELTGAEIFMLLALSGDYDSYQLSEIIKNKWLDSEFAETIYSKGLNSRLYDDLNSIYDEIKGVRYA